MELLFELVLTAEINEVLTHAEVRVLRYLLKRKNMGEMAKQVYLSPKTVRTELSNLERKFLCHSKTEVIIYCLEHGYIKLIEKKQEPTL